MSTKWFTASMSAMAVVVIGMFYATVANASSYSTAVVADGPVAYYHMAESSGTSMLDAVGSNTGTYGSGVTLGAVGPQAPTFPGMDAGNPAASFDGTVNGKSVVSSITGLSTTTYSMETWFDFTSNKLQYLIGRGSGASGAYDAVGLNGSLLGFFNGDDTNTFGTVIPVSAGNWHQLVFTRNGTAVNIYLDSVLKISVTSTITYGTSTRLVVGDRPGDLGTLNPVATFDEVSVYSTALTSQQVSAHYAAAFTLVPEPGSVSVLALSTGIALIRRRRARLSK